MFAYPFGGACIPLKRSMGSNGTMGKVTGSNCPSVSLAGPEATFKRNRWQSIVTIDFHSDTGAAAADHSTGSAREGYEWFAHGCAPTNPAGYRLTKLSIHIHTHTHPSIAALPEITLRHGRRRLAALTGSTMG